MQTDSPITDRVHTMSNGLAEAVAAAAYAPSFHDTQPWRWRVHGDTLDLHLQRSRVIAATDPATRLATLSCGAALHHARTVLSAEGWRVTVARMPDAADQDHLARLRVYALTSADPTAVRHLRTIPLRHTNRRPVTGAPVGSEALRAITASVQAEGAWLHMLHSDQVIELAAAADQAQRTETGEPEWQAELAYWTGGVRLASIGIPDAVIRQPAPPATVPGRDLAHPGDPAISAEHDRTALFAILYGHSDEPRDWLRAGEALSAGWLTATEHGISVLPLSAPVEVIGTRDTLRRLLSYLNHPYLVLRFGTVDPSDADAPDARWLPTGQTIE